jgi:thioredoxin-like negative regulator of GroEL
MLTVDSMGTRPAQGDGIKTLTASTFDALVLEGQGPIVVEFMSYGCEHCRVLEPILQRVAKTVRTKEQVFRVNVAVELELAASYAIEGTPTLVMFLDGREIGRTEGPQPTEARLLTTITAPYGL